MLSIARLFADDSSLSSTSSDISDLEGIINHDLQVISLWAKQWLVSFNPSKTEAMLFSTRPIEHNLKLMFDNTQATFVDDHTHLGLTFSSNGNGIVSHLNKIISSASSLLVRRNIQKLTIMYKSNKGETPNYITNLIPPTVNDVTNYNLRNRDNINILPSRLEIYKKSFIPSSV